MNFKTLYELWSKKPFRYEHLKLFGCIAYVHINEKKLEPRALRCIFLGYPKGIKGYKLWLDGSRRQKCFISKDVIFNNTNCSI